MRRRLVVGNWKMHETAAQAVALVDALLERSKSFPPGVEVVVAPPFTALSAVASKLRGSAIRLGAQTMHWDDAGAFTGEISPPMLAEFGVSFVILGHSERRAACGENDDAIARKVKAAFRHEITPLVAVGESLQEHEAGETIARVTAQARAAFAGLSPEAVASCALAYEPIWAIGSGTSDEPPQANAVMRALRAGVDGLADAPLLYGGSVNRANMAAFAAQPEIDGALVGGASLDAGSFAAIVAAAATR